MSNPITTAPRDGSLVFVTDRNGNIAKAVWSGDMWAYADCDWHQLDFDPTGWVEHPHDFLKEKAGE